jgi:hypothetical protein
LRKRLTLINAMGKARQLKPPRLLVLNLAQRVAWHAGGTP